MNKKPEEDAQEKICHNRKCGGQVFRAKSF